jgi:hypothetical protein
MAQETVPDTIPAGWVLSSNAGIALNQSNFNQAWGGDELGTVSWIATFGFSAERWLAPRIDWQNALLLQFGQTHQQNEGRDRWLPPQKSTDKITYRGIVLFQYWGFFEPFVAFDVDSQFFTKIDRTTRWLSPSTLTESAGIARHLVNRPQAVVLSRVGFALKQDIDRLGRFDTASSEYETTTSNQGGFEWYTRSKLAAGKDRTSFVSELRVFKAVETSENDPLKRQYWSAVDVDWQNTLTNKLAKWFAFDLYWQILYDKQLDKRGQFKQTLGFGLTWQLI